MCVARAPRKKSVDDYQPEPIIHNPHALPLFRDAPSRKRQREKTLKDPLRAHKPELPMSGPGHGGRVGTTGSSLLTQYLLKVKTLRVSCSCILISDCNTLKLFCALCVCSKVG